MFIHDRVFTTEMEVKQFYSRSVSPLVSVIFACDWSQDDRLSVVTERGLHVFEIKPAPHQAVPILDVSRSFVNPPKTAPADLYEDGVLSEIFECEREDVFSFLMNDMHTPNFPKAKAAKPEIIKVFWSPRGLLHPHKCLLAVQTSAGALDILVQIDKNWMSVCDLNSHWNKIIDHDFPTGRMSAACLRERMNQLLVTEATWSSLRRASFAYLVAAHRNSEITVWKVHRVLTDTVHLDARVQVEFNFRKKLIEDSIKINRMLWVDWKDNEYLLFVGYFNGQIGVLKLQEFEGGLTSSSYSTCYSDDDGVAVDSMEVLQRTDKQLELLVVKGMYLLILVVDGFGKTIDVKFVASPGFSITGTSIIDSKSILITTQDAKIWKVQKSHSQEWTCTSIRSDIAKVGLQYLGISSSRNKLLHVLVSSPSVVYDHLSNREPTNLCFFALHELPARDLVAELYDCKEQCLIDYWDFLDLIKVNALKRGALPVTRFRTENLDSMSLYELKVTYWILSVMETVNKKNLTNENYAPAKEVEEAKTCIFLYSASWYLDHLAQREVLSDTEKLSVSLLRSYLEIWRAGEEEEADTPLSSRVDEILKATRTFDSVHRETCSFCEDKITEPWQTTCPRGHKLTRCALTRLQVQGTKYRTCPICREIYHPCLDDVVNEIKCIYCDVPAVYKHLQIDPELLASARNLSKDKLVFIGSNKDRDKDKDEEDEA